MAKRSSESSAHDRLSRVRSEDIKNRKWSEAELDAVRRIAADQAVGDDSGIDYSDIPPLALDQLARMVRLREVRRKVPVSVRLDPKVLEWLRSKGEGHLTRINDILTNLMEAERRVELPVGNLVQTNVHEFARPFVLGSAATEGEGQFTRQNLQHKSPIELGAIGVAEDRHPNAFQLAQAS
jgi:uncharacterized protein (DUF4415 family)